MEVWARGSRTRRAECEIGIHAVAGLRFSSISFNCLLCQPLICQNGSLLRPDWCRAAVLRSILDCFRASSSQLSCVSPFRTHWNCSSFDRGHFGDTTGSIRWRGLSMDPCPVCHWRWLRHWLGSDRFRCWPGHCFRTMHWWHLPSAWGGRWPARCAAAVLGIHGVPDHLRLGHCPGAPLRQPSHQVRAQIQKLVEWEFFLGKAPSPVLGLLVVRRIKSCCIMPICNSWEATLQVGDIHLVITRQGCNLKLARGCRNLPSITEHRVEFTTQPFLTDLVRWPDWHLLASLQPKAGASIWGPRYVCLILADFGLSGTFRFRMMSCMECIMLMYRVLAACRICIVHFLCCHIQYQHVHLTLGAVVFVPLPLQAAIRMTVKDFKTSSPFTF